MDEDKNKVGYTDSSTDDEFYHHYVELLKSKDINSCFDLIPTIGVCKDRRFFPYFKDFLFSGDRRKEKLAICAFAAMADREALPFLFKKFEDPSVFKGKGSHEIQTALLEAIGDIGDDDATEGLMKIFNIQIKNDNFRRKRKVFVVETLGDIARQGGQKALSKLVELLDDEDFLVRATAITSISSAFWHRPNEFPPQIFERLLSLFKDSNLYVQYSLLSALENLADLGCKQAMELFAD